MTRNDRELDLRTRRSVLPSDRHVASLSVAGSHPPPLWRRAYVFPRRRRGTRVIAAVACVAFGVDRIGLADVCGLLVFVSFLSKSRFA